MTREAEARRGDVVEDGRRLPLVPVAAEPIGAQRVDRDQQDVVLVVAAQPRRTLLFVDEIHRFNRAQQDGFLPYVEAGTVTLVGATTENPSFELNAAVLSRAQVMTLRALDLGVPVRALHKAHHDAAIKPGGQRMQPVDDGMGARSIGLHDDTKPIPTKKRCFVFRFIAVRLSTLAAGRDILKCSPNPKQNA